MAKSWYLMTRPLFDSGYEKEEFNAYARDGFAELLDSFISTDVELYKTNDFTSFEEIKAVIQNVTTDSDYGTFLRQILAPINTIKCGHYVKYDGNFWLIRSLIDNNKMYEKGLMFFCNYNLSFISSVSNEIVTYPVYMKNATQYNSGEIARPQETIVSSKYLIFIVCDENTLPIDNGKRFLIDRNRNEPSAFELTQVDTVSYNYDKTLGVLRWTVVENQFNVLTDNKELMVADYYSQNETTSPNGTTSDTISDTVSDSYESATGGWL